MAFRGTIQLAQLVERIHEICDGVAHHGDVWKVECGCSFMLVPPEVGRLVLGLVDAEYGWPVEVHIDRSFSPIDLAWGGHRHPFYMRNSQCVAVAVSEAEYKAILARRAEPD